MRDRKATTVTRNAVVLVLPRDNLYLQTNHLNHPVKLPVQTWVFLPPAKEEFLDRKASSVERRVSSSRGTINSSTIVLPNTGASQYVSLQGENVMLEVDLIAKEAKYHNIFRRDYVRLNTKEEEQKSNLKKHHAAFQKLSMFLENEVLKKQQCSAYTKKSFLLSGEHKMT